MFWDDSVSLVFLLLLAYGSVVVGVCEAFQFVGISESALCGPVSALGLERVMKQRVVYEVARHQLVVGAWESAVVFELK